MCNVSDSNNHNLLSEESADERALIELRKQVKNQSGIRAELTRAKIKELEVQIKAENKMKLALTKSRKTFVKNLTNIVDQSGSLSVLSLDRPNMTDLILSGGYAGAVEEFEKQSDNMARASELTNKIIQPDLIKSERDQFIINLAKQTATERIFDELLIPKVSAGVRQSLLSLAFDTPLNLAMSNLSKRFEQAEKKELTEINTEISMYGRGVSAALAQSAGIDYFLYTGPDDGLTRPFCLAIVNKVVSSKQMIKLNNKQGLSVRTGGGGYNCRHSWTPVTMGFIKAASLDLATDADISKANGRAK